jgi:hypothetical protein
VRPAARRAGLTGAGLLVLMIAVVFAFALGCAWVLHAGGIRV